MVHGQMKPVWREIARYWQMNISFLEAHRLFMPNRHFDLRRVGFWKAISMNMRRAGWLGCFSIEGAELINWECVRR
jgi:hypothetical protein